MRHPGGWKRLCEVVERKRWKLWCLKARRSSRECLWSDRQHPQLGSLIQACGGFSKADAAKMQTEGASE
jgi:hypothetical protein